MYYLNINGVIKAYATQEEYQKAAAAQAAVSYPEFPLIQLSDETITHMLQRDGGECVELDGLRTPALYRVAGETPLGTSIEGFFSITTENNIIYQQIHAAILYIQRRDDGNGGWKPWGALEGYVTKPYQQ